MAKKPIRVAITEDMRIIRTRLLADLIKYACADIVMIPRYLKPSSVNLKQYHLTDHIAPALRQKALEAHLEKITGILDTCQVVMLPGNKYDVPPQAYGENVIHEETAKRIHDNPLDVRFETEWCMVDYAVKKRPMPILGICGGMQITNVYHGGSLVQHLPEDNRVIQGKLNHRDPEIDHITMLAQQELEEAFYEHLTTGKPDNIFPGTHGMKVDPDSHLGRVYTKTFPGMDLSSVPELSIHHQGCFEDNLGTGLKPVAMSPDGIVEAYEIEGHPYPNIFTQFHVECNVSGVALQVVETLVNAAK